MTEYDNTNSGIIFKPFPEQKLNGQGKINVDGVDHKAIMLNEPLKQGGDPVNVLYIRLGPLFDNDKRGNERAPDRSGPCDVFPNKKIAAWLREKDGRKFYSLAVSEKQQSSNNDGSIVDPGPFEGTRDDIYDDEIPF